MENLKTMLAWVQLLDPLSFCCKRKQKPHGTWKAERNSWATHPSMETSSGSQKCMLEWLLWVFTRPLPGLLVNFAATDEKSHLPRMICVYCCVCFDVESPNRPPQLCMIALSTYQPGTFLLQECTYLGWAGWQTLYLVALGTLARIQQATLGCAQRSGNSTGIFHSLGPMLLRDGLMRVVASSTP